MAMRPAWFSLVKERPRELTQLLIPLALALLPPVLGRIRRPRGYRFDVDGRQAVVSGAPESFGCCVLNGRAAAPSDVGAEGAQSTCV